MPERGGPPREPFPFKDRKVPVLYSVAGLNAFMRTYQGYVFCPYLAYKPDENAWNKSHARATLNRALPLLLSPPINITAGDTAELAALFSVAEANPAVVAVNITQPHKSNAVLKDRFPDGPINIDALIRDQSTGKLVPLDLNGPSFMSWYENDLGRSFERSTVVLVGVGGAGESIARRIMEKQPARLVLVDPDTRKETLRDELAGHGIVTYAPTLQNVRLEGQDDLVIINAAGQAGEDDPALPALLGRAGLTDIQKTFIDIRSQNDIPIVTMARETRWNSFNGKGMNARNDYTLISKIAEVSGQTPPSFDEWVQIVEKAS